MGQMKKFMEFCRELDLSPKSDFAVECYLRNERLNNSHDEVEKKKCKYCYLEDTDDDFCSEHCEQAYNKEKREDERAERMIDY